MYQVIHGAGRGMGILDIHIGHLAVAPGHLQAGVPQQALQRLNRFAPCLDGMVNLNYPKW